MTARDYGPESPGYEDGPWPDDCRHFDDDGTRCSNDATSNLENGYCAEHEDEGLPARCCNDPEHEAARAMERDAFISDVLLLDQRPEDEPDIDQLQQDAAQGDAEYGTPCLVCGAPIIGGYGHDEGCMARQPDAIRLGRICNECGAQLPSESEPGSPILMAHLRDEHPWRFEQRDHFAEAMGLSVQSGRENGHFR